VKKIIFFIVAIQIISSGNFFNELTKIDDLYQHYIEHKNSEEPLSVAQFIQSHYFDNVHEKSDPVKHAKLPLRQSAFSFAQVYHVPVESLNLGFLIFDISTTFNPVSKGMLPQCDQFSVFQPPKSV
jgi:hypothetical protein